MIFPLGDFLTSALRQLRRQQVYARLAGASMLLCLCLLLSTFAAPFTYELPSGKAKVVDFSSIGATFFEIETLADGRILIAYPLRRLNADLSIDTSFNSPDRLYAFPFALQSDGKIISNGGDSGSTYPCTVRLNSDGSLDPTFNAPTIWSGDNLNFKATVIQPDGKILIGCLPPTSRISGAGPLMTGIQKGIFRLNSDGSLDSSFSVNDAVGANSIVALPNGNILASCGTIQHSSTHFRTDGLVRIQTNGIVDETFSAGVGGTVNAIALQGDLLLIVGNFSTVNSRPRSGFARLQSNGLVDTTFVPDGGGEDTVKLQVDGKIITTAQAVFRFLPDGTKDRTFLVNHLIARNLTLAIGPDGRVYTDQDSTLLQYSAQYRVNISAATMPTILERSATVDGGWVSVLTVPAFTDSTYPDYLYPGTQNVFYRLRPSP